MTVGPNTVGISAGYHDAACCLIQGGKLVAAIQEDRCSRIKHDPQWPQRAFRACLVQAGADIFEIDCMALRSFAPSGARTSRAASASPSTSTHSGEARDMSMQARGRQR
jgi:predicted NodU family carbamoyl transferase